jgi:cathepsin L
MKFLSMHSCLLIASCLVIVASAAPQHLQWNRLIDASREEEGGEEENHGIKFPSLTELDEEWQSFKSNYGKTYNDAAEEMTRKNIFVDHFKEIIEHNDLYMKGLKSFTMAINEFSDLEHSEFVKMMTCGESFNLMETSTGGSTFLTPDVNFTLPNAVDWRTKGYVTRVKHQGSCGSCWAFSATGSLEGQTFRKTRRLVSLSEQQLVDCSRGFDNLGCKGGWAYRSFDYIKANRGIDTESSYPYEAKDRNCRYRSAYRAATCSGYVAIKRYSERELMAAVATVGPVSVDIDASRPSFQKPGTGVYNEPSCSSTVLNHAVLVVGYGSEGSNDKNCPDCYTDYWIVKNSWGTSWGAGGYIRMSRNKNNQCGIASRATYPLV